MTYTDAPDTSKYPVVLLGCGHTQPVAPDLAANGPGNTAVRVWCPRCALNVTITEVRS